MAGFGKFRSANAESSWRKKEKKKEEAEEESLVKYKSADNYVGWPNYAIDSVFFAFTSVSIGLKVLWLWLMSRVPSALYDESIMHDLKDTLGLQDRTVVVLVRVSQMPVFFRYGFYTSSFSLTAPQCSVLQCDLLERDARSNCFLRRWWKRLTAAASIN